MGVSAPSLHRESTDSLITRKWIGNMVKLSGARDSAHSREDTNILLAQITLRSDYSGSVKELL